ncbi:MAG TPA: protein kinase [Anaeromyxobacteraceae bacterium]|nr:protein kinase [Anaeromyxobacteraceae bacterium]
MAAFAGVTNGRKLIPYLLKALGGRGDAMAGSGNGRREGAADGRRPFGGRSISALLGEIARAPEMDLGSAVARLRPGMVVEQRFELVREIGRGGFGIVYEARDLALGRAVAFKVVAGVAHGARQEDRLLREAAAAARLSHPNIVQLHDMGRSEFGPFLVLELLRGRTLAERIAEGPLSAAEAVHVARDVAAALAHAHQVGVIHRDLNPRNVCVDEDGHARVLDFGLARALGQRVAQGGTPAYMAPEQWRGAPEDERTDVFALGVLLFEMLTGELPFPGDKGCSDGRVAAVLEVPDHPDLAHLVQRMLALDPVDRPRDGAAVGRELDEMAGTPASPAADHPAPDDAHRPRARRRSVLSRFLPLAASLVAGGLLGAALHAATLRARAGDPVARTGSLRGRTTVVVADPVNRAGDAALDAVSPMLITALEQSRALDVPGRLRLLDAAALDALGSPGRVEPAVAREVARRLGASIVLLPEVRRSGGETLLRVHGVDPVTMESRLDVEERAAPGVGPEGLADLVERAAAAVRQALRAQGGEGAPAGPTAVTRNLDAYRHYLQGQQLANETFDVPGAIAEYRAALAADPGFALPHLEMAILAGWHDAPEEDERAHMEAAARSAGSLPDKERRLVLGYKAFAEQRFGEATRILDALALDYPLDKQILYVAGEAFWHGDTPGGPARAASLFRAALDLDPAYLVAYIHLFEWLERFGPRGEALARAERAARFRPSAEAQAMVARALGASGQWPDALAAARSAASVAGGSHFESSYALAEVLFGLGQPDLGERELRRWLAPGTSPGPRRVAAEVLAPLLAQQGRAREARAALVAGLGAEQGTQYAAFDSALLAWMALAGGDVEAARRSLATHRPPPPGQDVRADRLAWFHAWLGDDADAAARAQLLPAGSLSERQYAAVVALRSGRPGDAAELLADVARRTPGPEPQFLLGLALDASGRHAEALQAFEEVRAIPPIYFPAALYVLRPWADVMSVESLDRLGRHDEARARAQAFRRSWSRADEGLPLVARARELDQRLASR